jgi:hypothetical protein
MVDDWEELMVDEMASLTAALLDERKVTLLVV